MFPERTFVIAGLRQHEDLYASYMLHPNIRILYDQTYEVLAHADAALVTSGTATLETALFEVPEVVCYKGGRISYMIGKQLVNIKYISLVNLIMDQPLLKELIQEDLNTTNVRIALSEILQPAKSASLKAAYKQLKAILGNAGASSRAAKLMFELATKTS
jgi:lipid-A-disaccharide synthase